MKVKLSYEELGDFAAIALLVNSGVYLKGVFGKPIETSDSDQPKYAQHAPTPKWISRLKSCFFLNEASSKTDL